MAFPRDVTAYDGPGCLDRRLRLRARVRRQRPAARAGHRRTSTCWPPKGCAPSSCRPPGSTTAPPRAWSTPELLGPFLEAAHRHGIRVVAWYLPKFQDLDADLARLAMLHNFTYGEHRFDGLASTSSTPRASPTRWSAASAWWSCRSGPGPWWAPTPWRHRAAAGAHRGGEHQLLAGLPVGRHRRPLRRVAADGLLDGPAGGLGLPQRLHLRGGERAPAQGQHRPPRRPRPPRGRHRRRGDEASLREYLEALVATRRPGRLALRRAARCRAARGASCARACPRPWPRRVPCRRSRPRSPPGARPPWAERPRGAASLGRAAARTNMSARGPHPRDRRDRRPRPGRPPRRRARGGRAPRPSADELAGRRARAPTRSSSGRPRR